MQKVNDATTRYIDKITCKQFEAIDTHHPRNTYSLVKLRLEWHGISKEE